MKLILSQFDSRLPFIQLAYGTAEGNEIISLNVDMSSNEMDDVIASPEDFHAHLEKKLKSVPLELYPANSNGLYTLSRIPYSFYKSTYPTGLNIEFPPHGSTLFDIDADSVQFAWCPSMGSYVVSNVVGPESEETVGALVLPVLFKDEVQIKNISGENLRAYGLIANNPFKDWQLSFSEPNDDVEQDFAAIVAYRDESSDKLHVEMMDVVCSDSELAKALLRNKVKGDDDFQVLALFEYYELLPLPDDGEMKQVRLRGLYEPKLGILERTDIADWYFANLRYSVRELLLPDAADLELDFTRLNESFNKLVAGGKLA